MRCLILHCKTFAYSLDHATPVAETVSEGITGHGPIQNCLVVFASAEPEDGPATVEAAATEIAKVFQLVKAEQVVLNPFAHLSNSLAKPKQAISILRTLAERLSNCDVKTHYSPFGWYKGFQFDVLAHNSSQLFRMF